MNGHGSDRARSKQLNSSKIYVRAHRSHPGGATVAVVAGVVDVLHINGVKQAPPGVPVVVAFLDGLAPVVEIPVAEQKAKATVMQIVLVVALDGVRDQGQTDLVYRAMPAGSGKICAGKHGLVYFGVGE